MLRALAAQGEAYMEADELAALLGKKPSGGHWNSGIAVLRNNGLIETGGRRYRTTVLFREVAAGGWFDRGPDGVMTI